jgi:hypothetical protein
LTCAWARLVIDVITSGIRINSFHASQPASTMLHDPCRRGE